MSLNFVGNEDDHPHHSYTAYPLNDHFPKLPVVSFGPLPPWLRPFDEILRLEFLPLRIYYLFLDVVDVVLLLYFLLRLLFLGLFELVGGGDA